MFTTPTGRYTMYLSACLSVWAFLLCIKPECIHICLTDPAQHRDRRHPDGQTPKTKSANHWHTLSAKKKTKTKQHNKLLLRLMCNKKNMREFTVRVFITNNNNNYQMTKNQAKRKKNEMKSKYVFYTQIVYQYAS